MKTFKQFLSEGVAATARKSMLHLQAMKPAEFMELVRTLDKTNGVLRNLNVSLKADGLGGRFGKNAAGEFFFEGSNTGPVFKPEAFAEYAKGKNAPAAVVERGEHYGELFKLLKASTIVASLPKNTKVVCELFFMPMCTEHEDGKVSFVTVKYDKAKLGKCITIMPINILEADSGAQHPEAANILKTILSKSSSEIKVVNTKLTAKDIDVSAQISDVAKLSDADLSVLKSLKAADKERKSALQATIQTAKDNLADFILTNKNISGKDILGGELEGLVLKLGDQWVKVTTKAFKDSKKKA